MSLLPVALLLALAALPADERLDSLGRAAYRACWELYPVAATRAGAAGFDSLLGDYRPENVERLTAAVAAYLDTVERLDTTALDPDGRVDRIILAADLKTELFWLERRRLLATDPYFYAGQCLDGVRHLLRGATGRAAGAALCRMRAVPGFIEQARANVDAPDAFRAGAGAAVLREAAALSPSAAADFAAAAPGLREPLAAAAAVAAAAMLSWAAELEARLPGLGGSFAIGKPDYDWLLRESLLLGFDSDSLLALGQQVFNETEALIRRRTAERDAYEREHPAESPVDRAPPDSWSKRDVLAAWQAEIDSMRGWTEAAGVATVPGDIGRLVAAETPRALRAVIPGLAMEPAPALSGSADGVCFVGTVPEPMSRVEQTRTYNEALRRGHRGGVVHEGFPGHFLQLSVARRNPSFIRRLHYDPCLVEGWALYCEQMAVEQGLYGKEPFPELRWLGGVRFRAARVIVDVKLQTGLMSFDDACRFLVWHFGLDTAYARAEVRRYCLSPTQPMSYLVGKLQLVELRDELRRREGRRFRLREFHDRVLAEGSMPVSLVRRRLLGR